MSDVLLRSIPLFKALDKFHQDYCLIGGTATVFHLQQRNPTSARATKDVDLVLELSTHGNEYGIWQALREFVETNNYICKCLNDGKNQSYRFDAPEYGLFPSRIEVFSQREMPSTTFHVQRITNADMSSIILPDEAIIFIEKYREVQTFEGIRIPLATPGAIVALKALACINILALEDPKLRKEYSKHINDIIKLLLILTEGDEVFTTGAVSSAVHSIIKDSSKYFTAERIKQVIFPEYPHAVRQNLQKLSTQSFVDLLLKHIKIGQ